MNRPPFLRAIGFTLTWAAVGLALAFALVWFFPGLGARDGAEPIAGVHPPPGPSSYHDAVAAVAPAVVNVYAVPAHQAAQSPQFQDPLFRRYFGDAPVPPGTSRVFGSGVIVDDSGLVVTNSHVISGAGDISVTLSDGRRFAAGVLGVDAATELALLQLTETQNLPAAPIGDSDRLRVGDVVLAIGNPYDFGQTVTQGIVSATGRTSLGITAFEDFIQTDADINPGNSGGALINARGELVGINTANFTESGSGGSQGIGFAIPVNLMMIIVRELIDHGTVERGWLGIEAQALPASAAESSELAHGGVMVAWVLRGSPAEAAGLQPGDVLTQINGRPVDGPAQAIKVIAGFRPGTGISLRILRGWEEMTVRATVGRRTRPTDTG